MAVQSVTGSRNPVVLSGVLFVLLWLGGSVWQGIVSPGGTFPRPTDPMDQVQAFFKVQATAVGYNAGMGILAGVALLAFSAAMSDFLKRAGRTGAAPNVVLAGGALSAGLLMIGSGAMAILAESDLSSDAASTQLLYQVSFWLGGPLHVAALGLMMAAAAVGLRGILPKWLNGFGLTVGVAATLASYTALVPFAVAFTPIGRFLGFAYLAVAAVLVALKPQKALTAG